MADRNDGWVFDLRLFSWFAVAVGLVALLALRRVPLIDSETNMVASD